MTANNLLVCKLYNESIFYEETIHFIVLLTSGYFSISAINNWYIIMVKFRYFMYQKSTPNNGALDKTISYAVNGWYLVYTFLNLIKTKKQSNPYIRDIFGNVVYILVYIASDMLVMELVLLVFRNIFVEYIMDIYTVESGTYGRYFKHSKVEYIMVKEK
eukprot:544300_1